jgi:hypothetical protein
MAVDIKMEDTKAEIEVEAQTDTVETGAGVQIAIGPKEGTRTLYIQHRPEGRGG